MKDSPRSIRSTQIIIGLRMYRYKLFTTIFLVGFQGARVPFPILINSLKDKVKRMKPAFKRKAPIRKLNVFGSLTKGENAKSLSAE